MSDSPVRLIPILLLGTLPHAVLGQDLPQCRSDPTHPRCGTRWVLVVPHAAVVPLAAPVLAYPVQPSPYVAAPLPAPVAVGATYPAYIVSSPPPMDALAGAMMFLGTSLILHDLRHPAPGPRFRSRR